MAALHDGAPGLTVQVTSLRGGRAANAIPERARMQVDIRASHAARPGAHAGGGKRWGRHDGIAMAERNLHHVPPLEPTPASERLAHAASILGAALGHPIGHASTGGVSDVCWVAWSGVPCLDGLGPVGGADHSPDEYVEVASFAPRAGVVAGLLAEARGADDGRVVAHRGAGVGGGARPGIRTASRPLRRRSPGTLGKSPSRPSMALRTPVFRYSVFTLAALLPIRQHHYRRQRCRARSRSSRLLHLSWLRSPTRYSCTTYGDRP